MNRTTLLGIVVFAAAMFGLSIKHVYTRQQELPPLEPPAYPARTAFAAAVAATGIIEPESQNIALGSALTGVVLEVFVPVERVGTHVERDEPLFRVDDRHLRRNWVWPKPAPRPRGQYEKLVQQPRPEEIPPSQAKIDTARANCDRFRNKYQRTQTLVSKSPSRSRNSSANNSVCGPPNMNSRGPRRSMNCCWPARGSPID